MKDIKVSYITHKFIMFDVVQVSNVNKHIYEILEVVTTTHYIITKYDQWIQLKHGMNHVLEQPNILSCMQNHVDVILVLICIR